MKTLAVLLVLLGYGWYARRQAAERKRLLVSVRGLQSEADELRAEAHETVTELSAAIAELRKQVQQGGPKHHHRSRGASSRTPHQLVHQLVVYTKQRIDVLYDPESQAQYPMHHPVEFLAYGSVSEAADIESRLAYGGRQEKSEPPSELLGTRRHLKAM